MKQTVTIIYYGKYIRAKNIRRNRIVGYFLW